MIVSNRSGHSELTVRILETGSGQLVEQPFGLFEVSGVEPFGEPVVDRGQQVVCFTDLPLIAQQPRITGCGA
jgi:hypothetical protein